MTMTNPFLLNPNSSLFPVLQQKYPKRYLLQPLSQGKERRKSGKRRKEESVPEKTITTVCIHT